jgi:hypothetical protein
MSKQKREKIGSYILQNMTQDKMIELTERAMKTNADYSFKLCLNTRDRNIRPGTPCKGKECPTDTTTSQCKENEKPVGIFYTNISMPDRSLKDLRNIHSNLISCIGRSSEIKCFKRKKEDFDPLEYDETIRLIENQRNLATLERERYDTHKTTWQTYRENDEKYEKEMDRIIGSYFDITNMKWWKSRGRK